MNSILDFENKVFSLLRLHEEYKLKLTDMHDSCQTWSAYLYRNLHNEYKTMYGCCKLTNNYNDEIRVTISILRTCFII